VIEPKKHETGADPACGTAGFLISFYNYILTENSKERKGDKLTPDERKRLMGNLAGYDISPDMVRISRVNMYLHGFSNPMIHEYDTLTSEDRWQETYDVILANPPFMSPKGGIRPHKRFSVKANRSEVLFVDYIAEHITTNGRAGVIVPEGIIFQSATAYKSLRKMLVDGGYLYAVVSLPAGVFNPYSGVKTSILFLDKALAKRAQNILFVKVENDGFDLGAQRKPIDKDDLPRALEIILKYKRALQEGKEIELTEEERQIADAVPKAKIGEKGEYNLSGERYKKTIVHWHKDWPMVELGEVCEVISGQSPEGEYYNDKGEGIPFYQGKTEFSEMFVGDPVKWTTQQTKIAEKNDILMSVRAPVGPVNIATQRICIGRALAAIRPDKNNLLMPFLFHILRNKEKDIKGNGGTAFDSINRKDIEAIKIPLPPLSVQQQIVAEIEGYQKIIDGAKQIIDNWKPKIQIDETWPVVGLGELVNFKTGKLNSNASDTDGLYPFFTCSKDIFHINEYAFDCEAVLLSGNNASGDFDVKYYKGKFNAYQRTYVITINDIKKMVYPYLKIQLESKLAELKIKSIGGLTRYLTLPMLTSLLIPLPPIEVQQDIIKRVEEERRLVEANNKLIEIFEGKIKAKIAEVWGE